jgi:uncharacterized membrane protein
MNVHQQALVARRCVLALIAALLCTLWSWQWLRAPSLGNALWTAIASVPILIPLRGILRGKARSFALATLCLTPYFIAGVNESIVSEKARPWAITLLGLSLLLFFALLAGLRLARQAERQASSTS